MSKNINPVLFWLIVVVFSGNEFRQNQWECLLVMFAALVLVPRGLILLDRPQQDWYALVPPGLCLAYIFNNYWHLALPYLIWAVWLTLLELTEILSSSSRKLLDFVRLFALGYWATGAVFALFYLANFQISAFDPVIISLTAAHFHVAGFVLSVVVYKLIQIRPNSISFALGYLSLFGMPLVAAGITLSKLGFSTILEQVAALGFVLFVLVIIWQQTALVFQSEYSKTTRSLWLAGVCFLIFGAALAGFYALRFQIPIQWVSIPNMKIWHGTINTLGFAWLSLIGYGMTSKNLISS